MLNSVNTIEQKLVEAYSIRINNLTKSIVIANQALKASLFINNKALIGKSYSQLALYHMIVGEMQKAKHYSENAIRIFKELGEDKGLADAKYGLAGVYYKTNQYHLGLIHFSDALKIYKKYDDYCNQSRTEKSLGTIFECIGDITSAFKVYKSAIRNAKKANDLNLESNVYNNLSGILIKRGKINFANQIIDKSIELKTQTNDIRGMAYALYGKGKVYHFYKEYSKAKEFYNKSLNIHKEMGENAGIVMVMTKLAALYFETQQIDKALQFAKEGLLLGASLQFSICTIKLNRILYLIYKSLGDFEKALCYFERHLLEKETVINTQTLKVIESYELIAKMEKIENEVILQREKQKILEKKNLDELENYKRKQEFLSIMSHEIRTPLNAIVASLVLLDDKIVNEGKKIIRNLKFASDNLISVVNDVLDFNRLDGQNVKLELVSTNINFLCQNTVEVFERFANAKNIELQYISTVSLANYYLIDPTKLTQILNNLISNAIKFTDKGSVQLELNIVNCGEKTDLISFRVTDTGEGISEENLPRIFESFSQLKPYLTRKHGGTGLGLAIVKRLIELHKSTIIVESELYKGTSFYFELELEKSKEILIKVNEKKQLIGKKVLIVDDTKMNGMLLSKLLSKWSMEIQYINTGKKAIEIVKNQKFDFILMDIHMPEMNGFEVSKEIKMTDNLNVQTPIFALTADVLADADADFKKYFSGIIFKPFDIDKLYNLLVAYGD
ncbi:hybrid sensor histidine kinase/response regulator [Flavobacterium columnare NBRC 100251 = ATCC 23463]|uniref:histidine kinase n=1 Tax=Flavobacterium columnare (strain ATCC 49512 / CIP 103533 / TG 44/87) TaxID=1041826 RepID=G8XBA6_FLACA|nr:ATP-binding protein [Flavobacterium columnare]AEW86074.1 PAS/PAC sensor hybrid histidine kinase [Flavobacterium columnare ATCC 49512]ANO48114.1 PAS/PAC sensor hybrid histidine kinase [Flavobacterium columnare]APT21315.1 hybrid sensor histidine kinase/response regulator [Flavobacterium columnare]MBF6651552.1 hybrid sensor histidine kinase/response regulator [Flavobacterium columnare]MBF6655862.1 hybrid sensor histidine kinase/response regulator [Flavobacterium columnare]